MLKTDDETELRDLASDNMDLLLECGFNKPLSKIHLGDKVTIIQ